MTQLKSKFRSGLSNMTVEISEVAQFKLSPFFPQNPKLWVLYFYGHDGNVVRSWYYDSEQKRQKDLDQVLERCPHLKVE